MKSLKESLFDNDIVEKGICFGNYYELEHFGFQDNNVYYTSKTPYNSMFSHFRLADLKKNYKSTDISNVQYGPVWSRVDYEEIKTYLRPLEYIVSLINSVEIASPPTYARSYEFIRDFTNSLQEKIAPYLKDRKIRFGAHGCESDITVYIEEVGIRHHVDDYNYTMNLKFVKK